MRLLNAVICAMAGTSVLAQDAPTRRSPSSLVELSGEVQALSRRISPGVVQISVSGYGTLDQTSAGDVSLFGPQRSTGSGVIVDSEGYILTNAHVIAGAVHIQVTLTSGQKSSLEADDTAEFERLDASIVGIDSESDLAVLKIEHKGLAALKFMNSDKLRQGDLVLTVGAPLGLRNSVSLGVVSAPARSLSEDNPIAYIQTDASINPGNSGGALVNMNGQLVSCPLDS